MKKLISLLAIVLAMTGCTKPNNNSDGYNRSSLSIITPTGAPAFAFYAYSTYSNFETSSNPKDGIIPQMVTGQKDVVVLPTNAGMQAILNKNANYQIAATLTFGNFYLVSLGNDENQTLDENDKILLFQQGNVPDKVFHYVYGDVYDNNVYYVPDVTDAVSAATAASFVDSVSGDTIIPNYVLLAMPALQNVLANKTQYSVYADMQAKYKEKSNSLALFQASVFIKKTVDKETANAFLKSLKKDVEAALTNADIITSALKDTTDIKTLYGVMPSLAASVTRNGNGMGLGFEYAKDNKAAIETFLRIFNIEGFDEEIYF